ncbi:hypothetical protein [Winogradskya humida]|uniref:Uncharacterized protein n=1 Tax=Winogradskya humida TaxID=113566 RepID=A0ABQ3ZYJ0_9ACTN|nr:hypothetical protein [Actinoplanes humidus]GIE23644.1 hypothetical protein Ahu01nite_067460 [Actinoplanes humidus]
MPDLDLTGIAAARAAVTERLDRLRRVRLALSDSRDRAAAARSRGDDQTTAAAQAEATDLDRRRGELIAALRSGGRTVMSASEALVAVAGPEQAVTSLSAGLPILMLPVRLETRFFDGGQTLKVRIFPDQAHVTSHDPAVSDAEAQGLTWYWTQRWPERDARTEVGRALADAAWQGLASRLRPGRAAFLVRTYEPGNLASADAGPIWRDLPRRSGEWSVAAQAALLPDRWCVLGYQRNEPGRHTEIFRRWGGAVPDRLAAGPSPDPEAATLPGGLPADPDLAWLHDVDEAERVGMVVTVRQSDLLHGARLADGVDRLIAVGVDWTLDPARTAGLVEEHLAAHADEGRMAFVPQGVPTNSTTAKRSPYTTDPEAARRASAPHEPPPQPDGSAGDLTTRALGLGGATLRRVAGADLREQRWQQALLEATWSATGGYYLTEMLDPLTTGPGVEAGLRQHVVANLRAGGPLPTVRIGSQPYGILPVMPRDRTEAGGSVQGVTAVLRSMVEPLVPGVPRLAQVRARGDVDDIMLALLQRMPVAWELTVRKLIGPVERQALHPSWTETARLQRTVIALLLRRMGVLQLPRLAELTFDEADHPLDVPLVLKAEAGGQRGTGYLGEIRRLLTEPDGAVILTARKNSVALLEAFLACAAPMENARAGKAIVAAQATSLELSASFVDFLTRPADRLPYTLRIEEAVLSPVTAGSTTPVPRTPLEFQQTVLPALTGDLTVGEFVAVSYQKRRGQPTVAEDPLHHRFDTALSTLEQAPADQLEWAFRGVLDLYSTRLDAWITSLATARLAQRRAVNPAGLYAGGWGVVEDLHPDTGPAAESLGFVHAPSLGQAASTAVLRSARLSHRGEDGRLFDLDLSSRRVRAALRLLEGVASGQRLAALLGYRFERGLQERDLRLAQWILPLRQVCPLRSERPDPPGAAAPAEAVAARDVVDGVALLARWQAERSGLLAAAGIATGDRDQVAAELDDLAGLADGVSDVLLAESVHQATVGNLDRSGAALAAHDRQAPAPAPEFVRTGRAGPIVTHRAGIWLDRDATAPADGWPADLRSLAEPRLDRWLGTLVGRPGTGTVTARVVREQETVPLPPATLADLRMSALSVVLSARRDGLSEAFAGHYALGPDDRLDLDTSAMAELLDVATWAADTISASPLAPEHLESAADVSAGTGTPVAAVDSVEAQGRATALRARVQVLLNRATAALASGDAAGLRDALTALTPVGPIAPGEDPALVLQRIRHRLDASGAADSATAVTTLLGDQQPFLPVLAAADPAPFEASRRARDRLLAGDGTALVSWLHRSALVRPGLDAFAALLVHAEADGVDVPGRCELVQTPHRPDVPWVALPFGDTGPPPAGTAGVVLYAPDGLDWARGGAGLLVDAWTETVPAADETTAVAFHFDAPGARAPQAMLLAVHPSPDETHWSFDTVAGCVHEAVDLAQLRTLGSPELAPLATLVPALLLPDAYTRDTPGIRFLELAEMLGGLVATHVYGKKGRHA